MLWHLIIIAICLFFSTLFSGSETSLFSISKLGSAVLRHTKTPQFPIDEELITMIDIGKEQGAITSTEEEILHNQVEIEKYRCLRRCREVFQAHLDR